MLTLLILQRLVCEELAGLAPEEDPSEDRITRLSRFYIFTCTSTTFFAVDTQFANSYLLSWNELEFVLAMSCVKTL